MLDVKQIGWLSIVVVLVGCSPSKPDIPSLTPGSASALLQFDNKAHNWLTYVKKQNPTCEYRLDIPDQPNHPSQIDLDHIVWCGGQRSPKEFDASVVFVYDTAAQKWVINRFSS